MLFKDLVPKHFSGSFSGKDTIKSGVKTFLTLQALELMGLKMQNDQLRSNARMQKPANETGAYSHLTKAAGKTDGPLNGSSVDLKGVALNNFRDLDTR